MVLSSSHSTLFPYTTLFRSGGRFAVCRPPARGGIGRLDYRAQEHALAAVPAARATALARLRGPSATPRLPGRPRSRASRSEEHTSELQSRGHLVCRLQLEKK